MSAIDGSRGISTAARGARVSVSSAGNALATQHDAGRRRAAARARAAVQIFTVPSKEAVASAEPSGESSMLLTDPVCAPCVEPGVARRVTSAKLLGVNASLTTSFASSQPVKTSRPDDETAIDSHRPLLTLPRATCGWASEG